MRHASIIKTGLSVACLLMIAGCAVNQSDINAAYDGAHRTGSDAMANLPGSMALVEDVPTAFLGDRLVPVAYEATLPATFREKKVTMPANIGIRQISTLISGATGYPVHLSPDVFVPRSSLVPRESAGGNVTTKGSNGNAYEEPVYGQVFAGYAGAYLTRMTQDLGLDWSFDGSTINITRFVTRMYQIAAIPGKVSIKSTMSKGMDTSTGNQANGTGGSGGNTGSFAATDVDGAGRGFRPDQGDQRCTRQAALANGPCDREPAKPPRDGLRHA
ncbi:hypothetical protein QFZ98_004584 [Paraburkholderia youngii]